MAFGTGAWGATTNAYHSAVIYYDATGSATNSVNQLRNLLGHFKTRAVYTNVASYTTGGMTGYDAVFYLGLQNGVGLPAAFRTDATNRTKPLVWINYGISNVATRFGLTYVGLSNGYDRVSYKGQSLIKLSAEYPEVVVVKTSAPAVTLATAYASTNGAIGPTPYAIRSSNFWYFADNPFRSNYKPGRDLVFDDLLHDILQTSVATNHRALVRIEDVNPGWSTTKRGRLLSVAATFQAWGIHGTCGVIPFYRDPAGKYNGGVDQEVRMTDDRDFQRTIRTCVRDGMNYLAHGYTHQHTNEVSGEGWDFWDDTHNTPMAQDSWVWATAQVTASRALFLQSDFPVRVWETPHYQMSLLDEYVFASRYPVQYEPIPVFPVFTDGMSTSQIAAVSSNNPSLLSQSLPYTCYRSIYGNAFIPENLGYFDTNSADSFGLVMNASNKLFYANSISVVRDGVASFFFHLDSDYNVTVLTNLVRQIQALGYTFTDINTLMREEPAQ